MFDFYDIKSPRIRERYCNFLYQALATICFICFVILPFLAAIIVPIVTHIYILFLLILYVPIGFVLFLIMKMALAVFFGGYVDLIKINSKIADPKELDVEEEKTETHSDAMPKSKVKEKMSSGGAWYCEKCGYRNEGYADECGNCYTPRK